MRGALAHLNLVERHQHERGVVAEDAIAQVEREVLGKLRRGLIGIGVIDTAEHIHLGHRGIAREATGHEDEVAHGGVLGILV